MSLNFITSYSGASFRIEQDILIKQSRNLYDSGLMQLAHRHHNFNTPRIYGLGQDHIAMQYLENAVPLPAFLNTCDKMQVNSIIKDIIGYIRDNKTGNRVFIRPDVIAGKISHIITRLHDYDDIKLAQQLAVKFGTSPIEIETGGYHGDLTFNNILVNNNDYSDLYLIDFLPGYAPTYFMDVVKLRQEVDLNWSRYFIESTNDNYEYALQLLKSHLDRYFSGQYGRTLRLMEALNYLRILPYAGDNNLVKNVLRTVIQNIIQS